MPDVLVLAIISFGLYLLSIYLVLRRRSGLRKVAGLVENISLVLLALYLLVAVAVAVWLSPRA